MGKKSRSTQRHIKHGILVNALKERGWNQSQAAAFLGVTRETVSRWILMKHAPRTLSPEVEERLYQLTGKTIDELWPFEIFLPAGAARHLHAPRPDEAFEKRELREILLEALEHLTAHHRSVLIKRFFEEKTLGEVAGEMGLTKERVRQIEARTLFTLRRPYQRFARLRAKAKEVS